VADVSTFLLYDIFYLDKFIHQGEKKDGVGRDG